MKRSLKRVLCFMLTSMMTVSAGNAVFAEGEQTDESLVFDLNIGDYTGFMNNGSLVDSVSGKALHNVYKTDSINYGAYKEETNGTPYIFLNAQLNIDTPISAPDGMLVEMWIAQAAYSPSAVDVFKLSGTTEGGESKVATRCWFDSGTLKLKNGGNDTKTNDKIQNTLISDDEWSHVVFQRYVGGDGKAHIDAYLNGELAGSRTFNMTDVNTTSDPYMTDVNQIVLGGLINRVFSTTDALRRVGGNPRLYIGELKMYNEIKLASEIKSMYEEDEAKYDFVPKCAGVNDSVVIDIDMQTLKNKITADDSVSLAKGVEIKDAINNLGESTPYITINSTTGGLVIDSARFERLPEQTYEMWIRPNNIGTYEPLLGVSNNAMDKCGWLEVQKRSYNQFGVVAKGNTTSLLSADSTTTNYLNKEENNDEWLHVVFTRHMQTEYANNVKPLYATYINGEWVASGDTLTGNSTNIGRYGESNIEAFQQLYLGTAANGGTMQNSVLKMDVAKFKVYDRFMTPYEAKDIYDSEKQRFSNNYSNDFNLRSIEPYGMDFETEVFVGNDDASWRYLKLYPDNKGGMLNLVFSTPIKPESITADSISLLDSKGEEIPGAVSIVGLSNQGYCLKVAYGKLNVNETDGETVTGKESTYFKGVYKIKLNGIQNLNGVASYQEKEFTVQDNAQVFTKRNGIKPEFYMNYHIDDALLEVSPFDGKTVEVAANYDIEAFDSSAVSISDMTVSSAVNNGRIITITTNEDFVAGSTYTVSVDGKTLEFVAQPKPESVVVGEVLYTDENGNVIENTAELYGTQEVNAVVDVTLRDDADVSNQDFLVILAVYDDAGKLIGADLKKCNFDFQDIGVQRFCANVDGLNSKATYRAEATILCDYSNAMSNTTKTFVWDRETLVPMSVVK